MADVQAAGALLAPRARRLRLHDRRAHPDPEGRAAVRGRSSLRELDPKMRKLQFIYTLQFTN